MSAVPVPDDRYRDLGRLLVVCPDRPGIVAAVTRFLHQHSANITESQQYSTDPFGGTFFLRIQFYLADLAGVVDRLREGFAAVAGGFGMRWRLSQAGTVKRVALFASRADHALQEILWRNRAGDLHAEIGMVISNHPDLYPVAAAWGVPYHHIPVSRQTRVEAERAQLDLLRGNGERGDTDLIVLARYMQILSPAFLAQYPNRIINIHHGFLPAFVGANPYQGAHDRGVKLIGATAHYATEELDAGPIIEQDVARVDHRHDVAQLRRIGRQVERDVLYRAVSWHLEDRVLVHGNKTIVFA
ncbi:MAG: formyltetrahydrofolate deformylase [Micromonosporaceae bacterium]|nr:formyltetrahydrofolate deformylase [Micromonosporaceae bacterium]